MAETERPPGAVAPIAQPAWRLTDRQARFVEERAKGTPRAKAGLIAGLAPSNVHQLTKKWEDDPRIADAIAEAQHLAAIEARVNPADILRELAVIAFSSLDDYRIAEDGTVHPAEDAPPYVMRAVQSIKRRKTYDAAGALTITTEIRLWSKDAALKLYGEHLAMWLKRVRREEDGEVQASLQAMRKVMERALQRQAIEGQEERAIAEFRQIAQASAVVADQPTTARSLEAARALAAAVAPQGERDP